MTIFFFMLAVICAFVTGFLLCISWMCSDNVVYNRFTSASYFEEIAEVITKLPANISLWSGVATIVFIALGTIFS